MGLLLAIDVGKGTEDSLVWDTTGQNIENAIQMILPSRTSMFYDQIQEQIAENNDIIIDGEIMAGEPWHKILYEYTANKEGAVVMSETAAMSLRYNLDQVRARGIEVITDQEMENHQPNLMTADVNWGRLIQIITSSGYAVSDIEAVLLSCQDHGQPSDPERSTRDYRMREIYSKLDQTGRLEDLLAPLPDISHDMPRHRAIAQSALRTFDHLTAQDVFVMDSSPAVVLGTLNYGRDTEIIINVGNGHTIVIATRNEIVEFAYELHTGGVTAERMATDIERIYAGELTHEQSLDEGGHGLYIRDQPTNLPSYKPYALIGPNRDRLLDLDIELRHPIGNMMMAGPYGLIRAYQYQHGS